MCVLKNGMGVILSNGEKLIVLNNMLINQNVCINLIHYNQHKNTINPNLNIEKVYRHISDKFNVINYEYTYNILKGIEDSELLFSYEKYIVRVIDTSPTYKFGDQDIFCTSLDSAIETYNKVVQEVLSKKDFFPSKSCVLSSDDIGYKATIVLSNLEQLENNKPIEIYIKVIMKQTV